MSSYSFTADSVTIAGRTFPAGYSVTPSGSVVVFVTLPDAAETARIRFTPDHADHAAALAAAQAVKPVTEDKPKRKPARKSKPAPVPAAEPVPEPAPEPPAEDVPQPEPEPAPEPVPAETVQEQPAEAAAETVQPAQEEPAPRTIPAKDFIGETITGHGWRIFFDGETSRTRVIFDADPTDAARAALDKAGFYFSPVMKSYNKKLTHKAHRAAVALSGELRTLYA